MLVLTHWGRVTHICVSNLTIIGSDNGLSPDRRQVIICTNAGILLIGPLVTNFSENLIGNQTFSLYKRRLKMSSAKWRPFCLGLSVLKRLLQFNLSNARAIYTQDANYVILQLSWRLTMPVGIMLTANFTFSQIFLWLTVILRHSFYNALNTDSVNR